MPWQMAGAFSFTAKPGKDWLMKTLLLRYLAVGAAGFIGAIARVLVGTAFGRMSVRFSNFPIGTLVINVSGSLFLGWFLTYAGSRNISDTTRLAIGAGFVGAYTTFSTYMFESSRLAQGGAVLLALLNLVGSLVLGFLAVRLGILLAHWS
jgi:CrcB protein